MSRDDNGANALGALLLGAAAGALAVILSDSRKRQKIRNTLNDWVDTGQEKLEDARDQLEDATNKGRRKLARKLEPDDDK